MENGTHTPESREELLREAERLVAEGRDKGAEETGPHRSFLVFSLGRQWFGVDLAHVRKVLRPSAVARVPGAMTEVIGLMNSQGEVLCLLGLRRILGMPPDDRELLAGEGFVIVVQAGGKEAGFLVDSVDDVWEVPSSGMAPVLESLDPAKAKLFEGTLERGGRFVGIISASMCLNP